MLALASGAVVGRTEFGERAGDGDVRVGRGTRAEAFVKGPLCADVDGFSLQRVRGDEIPGMLRMPRPGSSSQRTNHTQSVPCSAACHLRP
ncbi:MAG: hypothetical protein U1E73_13705 [Planctomycetota bacterium]